MRILVYEFATGGGLLEQAENWPELASLLAEGRAMVSALAGDFAKLGDAQATCLRERRLRPWQPPGCRVADVADAGQERQQLERLAAESDWTVVIAPEISGILADRCRRVLAAGGRLLGPGLATIALAADKHATAQHLEQSGVRVPEGIALESAAALPESFRYPAVWKPRDGAGSQGICSVADAGWKGSRETRRPGRLEAFCAGLAASVSFLCGPGGCLALPPCRQVLSGDGRFRYLGGSCPLPPPLADRAVSLAQRAVAAMPEPLGWLGVDLVLAEKPEDDTVIEINPRMTTSYVGLRAVARQNLAAAMVSQATGRPPRLNYSARPVQFSADGSVRRLKPAASGRSLPDAARQT